ncbi:homoaconitate hydratase [Candidatus Bathyarchaeota archaeon]|nr:homoaconitate hydratase [Candidatus Bathyarchaeota archaeon]
MALPAEVIIHDTTLREGDQTPGVVFNFNNKLQIAHKLDEVGIQQIEAGFPAASQVEREAVKALAKEGLNAKIFGFARAVRGDVDAVIDCDAYGLVLSFPPSDIHLKYKLKMTKGQYLNTAIEIVEYAKAHGLYITYSAEDSTRTDLDFLKVVFKEVVKAGVSRARIVDTLGSIIPIAMKYLVSEVRKAVNVPIEVHCHNDHGLAVANSLAAVEAGASVLSTSVNGLGERAGLAATEEVIIALQNLYRIGNFKTEKLSELCRLVEELSNVKLQPNKCVVGANIFAHASGIHQHGVIENPITYEPYPPEMVGQKRRLILGKLSGSHAVKLKLDEYNFKVSEDELKLILVKIKERSEERRSALSDDEFLGIVKEVVGK